MRDELDADGGDFLEESGDAWPDEPDEFDPDSLGPEVPSPPDPASGEVNASPELLKAFWSAVLFANVGLLGVSLGPMLVYFEGRTNVGSAVFLIGVLGLAFAYRRYHGYVHRDDEDEDDGDPGDAGGGEVEGNGDDERGRTGEHGTGGVEGTNGPANPTDTDGDPDHRGPGGGD